MNKVRKEIIDALNKALGNIASEVVKDITTKNDDDGSKNDDNKEVNVSINFDEEKLAKHLSKNIASVNDDENDNDDDNDDEYIDEYDEMSKKELMSECKSRELRVFSGTSVDRMKKKLRDYDENAEKNKNDKDNDNPDNKNDASNLEKAQKQIKDAVSKVVKDLGLDEKQVGFDINIKGEKKSIIAKSKKDDDKFDDDGEEIKIDNSNDLMKAFDKLESDEREEMLGYYLGKKYFDVNEDKFSNNDDEEEDDD